MRSPWVAARAVPSIIDVARMDHPDAHRTAAVMAALTERGMLLESARGPLPNVAELVAGEPIRGSWWSHAASHAIYRTIEELSSSPDVVRLRLLHRKVTLVHRRLWPALTRVAPYFPVSALTALTQEHTKSGAHRTLERPYPHWIPPAVASAAQHLTEDAAFAELPPCVRPPGLPDAPPT
jgi:hypothetical protein